MRLPSIAPTAVTLLALALPCLAAENAKSKRDDSASEKLGLKLSLQCWTYNRLTFFETVDVAAGLGIKYLEIFPGQKLKPGSEEKISRDMSEEWAKKMGIEVLVTETTPNEVLDKLSNEFHIRVAIHNHPSTWPPDEVLKACKDKGKLIGSCSDTGHWMRAKLVPVETLKKLEGRVMHLHFKDLNDFGSDVHDVPWGTGKGNPKGMMEELKRQGYKGYLSIEYEYGDLKDLAVTVPKCIAFFDKTAAELAR